MAKVSSAGTVLLTIALRTEWKLQGHQKGVQLWTGMSGTKVYFETLEVTEKTYISHTSTVRGCSSECKSRDDFKNCTMLQRTLSGCVRKDCCSDTDLCNSAEIVGMGVPLSVTIIACVMMCVAVPGL
ncbi:hypothetical protein MAR_006058 [Mya arenaria]|uniref:Uncharacterized protein n=1 Tax=Mya arenaria TaxID=6604 RepID=A0ABY7D9V7_MYAAR|nr:hypothetical protein MAR_006058 [Mya arenaria]